MEKLRWVAPPGAGRLDKALAEAFPDLSRARVQALIAEGAVTVDGEPARASAKVPIGAVVELTVPPPVEARVEAEDIPLEVLHEDAHLVVLVKPAGMVVHPSPGHFHGTLVNALLGRAGSLSSIGGVARPGIVHRLDAGTSGVMVVAKDDVTHRALSELFARHDLERRYVAVVHRAPIFDGGTFRSELARDPKDRLRIASVPVEEAAPAMVEPIRWGDEDDDELELDTPAPERRRGRLAVTHWRVLGRADRLGLVECRLETGRTHQVRVHLSEAGHPIVGDTLYGRRDCVPPRSIRTLAEALTHPLLHAWHLGFRHPRTGETIACSAPPPPEFLAVCAAAELPAPPTVLSPWRRG